MILSTEEHKQLCEYFPKVKTRCPVCYIDDFISEKVRKVIDDNIHPMMYKKRLKMLKELGIGEKYEK